ncbi:MAG TPA: alpha/beta fold hydrolase, partial [Euzebya sp.]|nr:alpha/beta fold hydrolase [Euzebya sp.]
RRSPSGDRRMTTADHRSAWLVPLAHDRAEQTTLICFPFAGGSAQAFTAVAAGIPDGHRVLGVQLPGRGSRLREALLHRVADIVEALVPELAADGGGPYVFLGTSMGALVAFECARALRRRGLPPPAALVVVTARPPQLPDRGHDIHALPREQLVVALQRYGGTPPAVLAEPDLMDLLLPMVRADFAATETYVHAAEAPLDVPIVALGGREDPFVPVADLDGWAAQTCATYRQEVLDGDHFFYREPEALGRLCAVVAGQLLATPSRVDADA